MTKKNRQIVETFSYKGYTIDIYDTQAVEIHGTSESYPEQNFHVAKFSAKKSDHQNGCRLLATIGKLGTEYDTGYLHKFIDLFDAFARFNGLTVDNMAQKPRKLSYENDFNREFLYQIVDRKDLSDIKKWCILSSVLSHYNRLTREGYAAIFEDILQNQVEPEDYAPLTLEESEYYTAPFFLSKNVSISIKKEVEFKNVHAVTALYAGAADTLGEAYEKGFVPLKREMEKSEIQALRNSYDTMSKSTEESSFNLDKKSFVAFYGVSFLPKLPKEMIRFITDRVVKDKVVFADQGEPYKTFYLTSEEFEKFEQVVNVNYDKIIFERSSHINEQKVVDWAYLMLLAYLFVSIESEVHFMHVVQEIESVFDQSSKKVSNSYSWSWSYFANDWKARLISPKNQELRNLIVDHMKTSVPIMYLANLNNVDI